MKKLTLVLFLLISGSSFAQLMDGIPASYTRADSIRGTLSTLRSSYDVSYYHLDITLDIAKKFLSGSNTIRFKVVNNLTKIQVDLFANMKVDKILWRGKSLPYTREFNAVFISFPVSLKKGETEEIAFYYSGNPTVAKKAPWDGGLVFSKDKAGNDFVGTACQGTGASLWWPTKDHQSDEPDSMQISVTIPSEYQDVSNGRLRSTYDLGNGNTQYNWFVANPINTYGVTMNVAKYEHFSDQYTSADGSKLSLDYYVLPENIDKAKAQFEQVKPMMKVFEKYFGKYPFYEDGYKLVETPFLGMEHQSAVAYGNKYKNGYLGMDLSGSGEGKKFDYIIIHESAHEWWGNNITTADIADMWVHEGFGQYSETVYLEGLYGKESGDKYMNGLKHGVENKEPVIGHYGVNSEGSGDMYPKGALMLNSIRNTINDDAKWWKIVLGIQTSFRHQVITSSKIEHYISDNSGIDLQPVFDQYLRHAAIPVLEVKYTVVGSDLEMEYRWNVDVSSFNMPVEIQNGTETVRLKPTTAVQKITIKNTTKENVKVDKSKFYINVKELS